LTTSVGSQELVSEVGVRSWIPTYHVILTYPDALYLNISSASTRTEKILIILLRQVVYANIMLPGERLKKSNAYGNKDGSGNEHGWSS
jgi:hypothetical protein